MLHFPPVPPPGEDDDVSDEKKWILQPELISFIERNACVEAPWKRFYNGVTPRI